MNHWHAGVNAGDHRLHVGQHVAAIILGAQHADPTVEQLHGLGAGFDLSVEIAA